MSSSYFHEARGDYNIAEQRIRLNFKALAGDPTQAQLTMMHEWVHRLLADTDFGQAIHIFYRLIPHFTKLIEGEVIEIANLLYDNQQFVQEGFATFIQYGRLVNLTNRETAERWRSSAVSREYQSFLNELVFAFDFSLEERELFSGKISNIAMETGIRRFAVTQDLFSKSENLKIFLSDETNSPNQRLHKLVETIKKDKLLLNKENADIAKASGISYNIPSTKEEVAAFLNYLVSFTAIPTKYSASDVSDALPPSEAITQSMDKMIVANLSMNLVDSATVEFGHADFLLYADEIEIIFVTSHDDTWDQWGFVKDKAKRNPEIGITAFLPTGNKVITYATKSEATNMLNGQLKHVTFATHWSWFNATTNKIRWSESVRKPDIVIYDTTENMGLMLKAVKNTSPATTFTHLHAAMMEGHPLQSLLIRIGGEHSIHIVNHFENKNIVNLINIIRGNSTVMGNTYLRANKKHVNNFLSSWNGLFWEVDWVEGMLDPNVPHFRVS
jgi:hypothetical protein